MNSFKETTASICRQKGWDRVPIETVWLLLTEEVGELASAIRQYKRTYKKTGLKKDRGTDVKAEMGDVFSYLFQIAHMLNVDLDDMWQCHQKKVLQRNYISSYNNNK